jgi:hypothetical protein
MKRGQVIRSNANVVLAIIVLLLLGGQRGNFPPRRRDRQRERTGPPVSIRLRHGETGGDRKS